MVNSLCRAILKFPCEAKFTIDHSVFYFTKVLYFSLLLIIIQRLIRKRTPAIYSYEGTKEINSLIVGRSITGFSAFV